MTTFATGNPVPSTAMKDLLDNAENFDVAVNSVGVNWVDRLGVIRVSWAGMQKQVATFLLNQGFQYLGDYDLNGPLTIGAPNQVFSKSGNYYRPGPSLALPYTTVNNWTIDQPKFLVAGDGVLRNDLTSAALDKGISFVAGGQRIVSTVAVLKTMPSAAPAPEVKLSRWRTGGPIINSEYELDLTDTTTTGDDFLYIRTTAGQLYRLKHTGWATLQAAGAMMDDTTNDADAWDRFSATSLNLAGIGASMTSRMILWPTPTPRAIKGANAGFKLRSQDNTDHETTFRAVSPVGLLIKNFDVNANSFNRTGVLTTRTIALEISSGTDCILENCIGRNAIGSAGGIPGVCIATSGSGLRVNTLRCKAFNGGSAVKPADGFFCSSSYSTNIGNYAENCFDTGHVIESCSFSGATDAVSKSCGAGGAISNAIGSDTYGCYLDNLHVENWRSNVTGGVQILCAAAGGLIDCRASVTLTALQYGDGPGINFRETGTGRINGFDLTPSVRGSSGTTQCILGSGQRIKIISPSLSGSVNSSIQFGGVGTTVTVEGGEIIGGTNSMATTGSAALSATGTKCRTPSGYCMYAFDTSGITYNAVIPISPGVGYTGRDAGGSIAMFGAIAGGLALQGLTAGATSGVNASKIPVYGPAGATLGFIPIYPS